MQLASAGRVDPALDHGLSQLTLHVPLAIICASPAVPTLLAWMYDACPDPLVTCRLAYKKASWCLVRLFSAGRARSFACASAAGGNKKRTAFSKALKCTITDLRRDYLKAIARPVATGEFIGPKPHQLRAVTCRGAILINQTTNDANDT